MKKYILIIAAVFAAALLVPGCYPNENVEINTKSLTISLFSDEPETKADPTRETTITHFDYFFFKDATGTQLIDVDMQGRADGSSKTFETGLGKDFVKLRKVTSYVYIIANFPTEIDHTQAWTLEQLKALEFESKLVKAVDEETGAVTFFTDMVMDSFNKTSNTYTTELTPALVDEARTVPIGLTRIASKLVLNFTIPASIAGSMTGENEAWTPVLKDLRAYYVNALNNRSTVGATPIKRSAIAEDDVANYEYFSYPTNYPITPDPLAATPTEGKYKFNTGEVYTYPQTWTGGENGEPYFKIQMTWYSNIRGTANFYYKILAPKPATDGTVTIDRNTCYVVDVTLNVIDTENEYVVIDPANYTVHEWAINDWKGGGGNKSARFFNVPKKEFTLYSEESLDIPFASSSAVTAYFTEISYWYYGSANGTLYEFRFDPEDKIGQVTLPTNQDSNGTSLAVKDCWGSNTNAARDLNQYSLTVHNKYVTFNHPLTNIFSRREIKLTLVNEEGRSANVVITQRPAIEIIKHPTKNGFLDGRFNIGEPEVCDQYGNLIGKGHQTSYISAKYYYQSNVGWPTSGTNSYGAKTWYGSLYSGGNTTVASDHYFITEVSISAFNEDNNKYQYRVGSSTSGTVYEKDYRLGDPRVTAEDAGYTSSTFVLPQYLVTDSKHRTPVSSGGNGHGYAENNATAEYAAWEEPLKILIASQQADDRNVIAPRFLVSSSMNITSGVDWNTDGGRGIVQRCAMYQEAGYPAGRWRLPTEAEFAFMMKLQGDGNLPMLFADCDYRMGDGGGIRVNSSHRTPYVTRNPTGTVYIRMVYDLWYWGDDPTDGVDKIRTADKMTDWEKATDPVTGEPNWKARWADYYHANMHEH